MQSLQRVCQTHLNKLQASQVVKNPPANAGDVRDGIMIPGLRKFPWRRA